jgi:hypothetical protein
MSCNKENEGINIAQEYAKLNELESQRQEIKINLDRYISEISTVLKENQ